MGRIRHGVVIGFACALLGAVGCGDDDAAAGTGGGGSGGAGSGGSGGTAGTSMPATHVGDACSATSDCDGPHPVCLDEIDPTAPFAALAPLIESFLGIELPTGGADMDGGVGATIATPGGYCSSMDCSSDAQCGEGAACYSLGSLLAGFTAGQGGGIDLGGLGGFLPEGGGYCLETCEGNGDCSRSGYACRPLIDLAAFGGADGGFEVPFDAGGFALPDGGFSLPDGGVGVGDGGLTLPTYCLPELPDDSDAGDTVE